MDKNAIKKYAVWARTELLERVKQKALQYGISEKDIIDANADSINGKLLTEVEKKQRKALIGKVNDKGFEQVMEEVAYTWFNRFSALRFMEVNGYLPSHVRVFTDEDSNFKPQILTEAIHLDIDDLDIDKVYAFKEENKNEELYKYLLIIQCNALNKILPGMFQKISDYTELLLPDNLLREGSVIQQMIEIIPEDDWKDAVQIIGWLYQYYNSVPKDNVFANLKKNIKIKKEDIPAATQLFTPDWIVRYMVENSLGRLWYEGHPDEALKSNWKYYLDEAEQESEVQAQLDKIHEEYKGMKPEDIKCIDPCMGSGHILVYMFDVLMQIYESYGYNAREAVASIVENNLYGLDIDDRAAQLAYFAVMMKARQYDRRFFLRGIQPNIHAIVESNNIGTDSIEYFTNAKTELKTIVNTLINEMHDAKEYGSILNITNVNLEVLYRRFNEIQDEVSLFKQEVFDELLPLVKVIQVMNQKYDIIVTNPPYMGSSGMGAKLSEYVKKNYPDSKSDLFAVFIEKCCQMTKENRYLAMITQHSWMFLSSFEKMRSKILLTDTTNMVHLGSRAFEEIGGEVVQTTAWIQRKSNVNQYKGIYCRLVEPTTQQGKEDMFLAGQNRFIAKKVNFSKVPGAPIAYWVNKSIINIFENKLFFEYTISDGKNVTGNNDKFLRLFWEVSSVDFGVNKKWLAYVKGGTPRKWYGNLDYVIDWSEESRIFYRQDKVSRIIPEYLWYKQGITWTLISSGNPSFRYKPNDATFDSGGLTIFLKDESYLYYYMAMLNSPVFKTIQTILNPTLNLLIKDIRSVPIIICKEEKSKIDYLVKQNIDIAKTDWDSFETSWEFVTHPLIKYKCGTDKYRIKDSFECWESNAKEQSKILKKNEEELNRIFITIYNLGNELTPEIEDKDVTVRKADCTRDIKSFISYAVGCMFGRYSLDVGGIAYAGGDWDNSKYNSYPVDLDNIIPICDDEYFEDDIAGRFIKFVEKVYGKETLDENLKFIADALGGKGSTNDIIRNYFLNNFFTDHCKIYQKRPIYWLFDSGKNNGFKCLIYMHRYQPDTIARIRTDYVHEQQARYRTAIADLEQRVNSATTSERVKLNKQLTKLRDQEIELRAYEEKIHHLADQMIPIDLDDGVKVNYAKFQDVLAKIK